VVQGSPLKHGFLNLKILAEFLNNQTNSDFEITYEKIDCLNYEGDNPQAYKAEIKYLQLKSNSKKGQFIGDFSSWHLPYIDFYLSKYPKVRVVATARNDQSEQKRDDIEIEKDEWKMEISEMGAKPVHKCDIEMSSDEYYARVSELVDRYSKGRKITTSLILKKVEKYRKIPGLFKGFSS